MALRPGPSSKDLRHRERRRLEQRQEARVSTIIAQFGWTMACRKLRRRLQSVRAGAADSEHCRTRIAVLAPSCACATAATHPETIEKTLPEGGWTKSATSAIS